MRPGEDQGEKIDPEQWMELYNLLRALLKRVEALEKHVGLNQPAAKPCVYCNVVGGHQAWCNFPKTAPGGSK